MRRSFQERGSLSIQRRRLSRLRLRVAHVVVPVDPGPVRLNDARALEVTSGQGAGGHKFGQEQRRAAHGTALFASQRYSYQAIVATTP